MSKPPKLNKKALLQKVEIEESDGKKKVIGRYDPNKNIFTCTRYKQEHFMRKYNAWGLDKNVADFLASKKAYIIIKDMDTKWEYKCFSLDLINFSKVEEHKTHRTQYFLSMDYWEVINAKNRSMIIECLEKDCDHNFGKQCMNGTIKINGNGECSNYEDRLL